jgi:hypothetical protein
MNLKIRRTSVGIEKHVRRYRVTPFRGDGIYPRGIFSSTNGCFYADDDVVFAVTHCATWRAVESLPYSEVDWMNPELVRILGSLIFCERFTERRCWFYPYAHADLELDVDRCDLSDAETILQLAQLVRNEPLFTSPTKAGGIRGYLFDPTDLDIEMREMYWDAILAENRLVMRGIQALIKCDMLAIHPEFQEEAAISTFIALDASFELTLRHLRSTGIVNPSAASAAEWFHNTFDGPAGVPAPTDGRFFGDFYPQRIQTLHPGSRLGDAPFAAITIDDRIHLRQALPGLFAYLVTGEHAPHWKKWIAEAQARLARGA